jgi:Protein of unknown function (DUF3662)/FHA domain
MERSFTRATRSHLQPVEIGKRLVRVMESRQTVGVEGVLVPNMFNVALSSYDFEHFEPMRQSLAKNLESHLARVARQRRFQMVSPPVVRLQGDDSLDPGEMRIEPRMQDADSSDQQEFQHTSVLPKMDGAASFQHRPATPNLILDGNSFAVLRSPTKLGRQPDNDIVMDDRRVSRHHAEVIQRGERWVLRDTGSTNGTAVNGKVVKEAVLKPGDAISLGGLEVTWEQ